jgi:hypothetical protein
VKDLLSSLAQVAGVAPPASRLPWLTRWCSTFRMMDGRFTAGVAGPIHNGAV